jgi:large subunit ribosomal protein L3
MCKGLLGKKLGMTGVFSPTGAYIPVTVIQAGPCVVTQIKTEVTDGYNALQLGFGEKKEKRTCLPLKGHFKKSGGKSFFSVKEFAAESPGAYTLGQTLSPSEIFKIGERIKVTGKMKGRGFTGVVKRHGFRGGDETHGCNSHRVPGSIGSSAWPSRVTKGKKLPGQYGNTKKTVRNLEIVDIHEADNLILVKGAVPGAVSGWLALYKTTEKK